MEIRHLRCFLAVAEELHFARAAERLHIEQSPLSRTIKELEESLGEQLFIRTSRSTRLTRAGKLFLEHVPRIFTALQQARDSVNAATNGFHGQLRIALSDGITPSRLPSLLALCRQEEPEVEIRLFEVPLSQQIKGLHDDLYDVGFAQSDEVGEGITAEAVWSDALMVAVPARHPLLKHRRIPLEEVLRYPLVLCDPHVCEGHARQVERVLRRIDMEPLIAERVASCDLMMALVSAGFALGLAGAPHIAGSREPGIVARPLAGRSPMLTTYVLHREGGSSDVLSRFIERVQAIESPDGIRATPPLNPIPKRKSSHDHEADRPIPVGRRAVRLRPVRNTETGSQCTDRGRAGRRSCAPEGAAPPMQDRASDDGRCAVQPRGRSNEQALLRRRQGALHAIGNAAEALTVGGLPHILIFFLDTPQRAQACGVFTDFVPA